MNESTRHRVTLLGGLILAGAFGQRLSAATVFVGTCGTPTYTTIQAAVNASAAGGTIKICPGTYREQIKITKNLTLTGLQGTSAGDVVITSPTTGVVVNSSDLYPGDPLAVAAQVLVQNATSVNLSTITVDGSGNLIAGCAPDLRGIYYQNASGIISNVATRNQVLSAGLTGCQAGQGIFVQTSYVTKGIANVTIQNNSVHTFQKNGITVDGPGATGNLLNNYIAGQGPTNGAGENGVQISDGAGGSVIDNVVIDEIWAPDTSADTGDAAAGILVYSSQKVIVQNNTVGTTQFGIVTVSDANYGTSNNPLGVSDHTTIGSNIVMNTQIFDAIDTCSNNNTIQGNIIYNATESAIHLDGSCGSTGKNNVVLGNTINEACAGILQGGTPNQISALNSFSNVGSTILAGNSCGISTSSVAAAAVSAAAPLNRYGTGSARPSPMR